MRILLFISLLWLNAAFADSDIDAINKILNRSELSKGNYSLYITNISKRAKVFSYNEQKSFNPASVMKLVTTYAGLQFLAQRMQELQAERERLIPQLKAYFGTDIIMTVW